MANSDIRLGISAVDLGASRLLRDLTAALRALSSQQAKQADSTKKAAAAARSAAESLAQQSRLSRAAVIEEQNRLRATTAASNARIAQIRKERDEAVAAARVMARANLE